jgi:hypothetical protein
LVALGLGACADPNVDRAIAARGSLVGMPKDRLLACAGVPDGTATASDGTEYLTYRSQSGSPSGTGLSIGIGGVSGNVGGAIGVPLTTPAYATCEATFVVRDGAVQSLGYRGNTDGTAPIAQCWNVVANCVPPGG